MAQAGQIPGAVFALAQTSDGNLWVGTEFGLVRYDGTRFLPWQPPAGEQLSSSYIIALAAARDGSLWIGTRDGLSHTKPNTFETYRTSRGPGGPGVAAILEDHRGTVWAGTAGYKSGGLCQVRAHSLDCADQGLAGVGVLSLFEGRSGDLWAGGAGGLTRWTPGFVRVYRGAFSTVESVSEDGSGRIWVSTDGEIGVSRLVGERLEPYQAAVNRGVHPRVILHDRDGGLWIGTVGQGLVRVGGDRVDRFTHMDGLSNDDIRCIFEDREGNIWVGTAAGLDRFRDIAVKRLSTREGLASDIATSIFPASKGGIWIGTPGGLNHLEQSRIRLFDHYNGLPWNMITAMFEDRAGRLWIDSDRGISLFDGRQFHENPFAIASKMRLVTAAAEDRDGSIWFSDRALGLVQIENDRVVQVIPWSVFQGKQVWAIEPDLPTGGLWLGFAEGGLAWYKRGQAIRWYGASNGLGGGLISDLHMSKDHTLWIATENGLSQFRQSIVTLDTRNGLPCNRIHAMVEDDRGALWLNTACGLARIDASDLANWSRNPRTRVAVKLYDNQDGMLTHATPTGYFRRAARSNDGRLWFAGISGLAVIDPRRVRQNRLAPPVAIEQISADHTNYLASSQPRLPPLTKEVEIDYAAFSFVAPEKVRFQYRLEGFDRDWKDVGGRRQALYTNLPPRRYRFQVIAANNDGVWNSTGASVQFSIEPAVYQTTWFFLLCVLAFVALLWTAYRLRVQQVEHQLNLKYGARLAERTRIARELHDTIVQNISGLALQLDGLAKVVATPEATKDRLLGLRIEAERWLREVRESVWDLRAPATADVDLRTAFERVGQQVIVGEPVELRITVTGKRRPPSPYMQEQLIRIAQEAMRNAVHRGHAKHLTMRLSYQDGKWIRVLIRDDGCGFDPAHAAKVGHCGLATMLERAERIGAELKIHSAPGQGAEVEIVAPMREP